jgi:hypothetical protein
MEPDMAKKNTKPANIPCKQVRVQRVGGDRRHLHTATRTRHAGQDTSWPDETHAELPPFPSDDPRSSCSRPLPRPRLSVFPCSRTLLFVQESISRCREKSKEQFDNKFRERQFLTKQINSDTHKGKKTLATRWRMSSVHQVKQTLNRKGTARNPTSWTGTVQVWTSTKQSLWLSTTTLHVEILMRCNFCQKGKRLPSHGPV